MEHKHHSLAWGHRQGHTHGGVGVGGVTNAGQSGYMPCPCPCSIDKMSAGKDHLLSIPLDHLWVVHGGKVGMYIQDTCVHTYTYICIWNLCVCACLHAGACVSACVVCVCVCCMGVCV